MRTEWVLSQTHFFRHTGKHATITNPPPSWPAGKLRYDWNDIIHLRHWASVCSRKCGWGSDSMDVNATWQWTPPFLLAKGFFTAMTFWKWNCSCTSEAVDHPTSLITETNHTGWQDRSGGEGELLSSNKAQAESQELAWAGPGQWWLPGGFSVPSILPVFLKGPLVVAVKITA